MKKGIKKLWNKIKKFFKAKDGDDNKFSITEVCLIILCTTIISILVGILLDKSLFRSDNKYSAQLKELINNYQYIVNSYYGEVDENKLVDAAISGIVNELGDTYSNYFSESQAENFDKMLTGSYEGIGVQIGQYANGDIVVVSVFENSSTSSKVAGVALSWNFSSNWLCMLVPVVIACVSPTFTPWKYCRYS